MALNYNLYYNVSGKPLKILGLELKQWTESTAEHWKKMQKGKGLDTDSMLADPMFVDSQKGDFRLKPESPAFKLGFRPIDLSTVGVRPREPIASEGQR